MTKKANWCSAFPNQMSKKRERKKYVNPVSKKRKVESMVYNGLRVAFLEKHSVCEVCCFGTATEIHHKKGRGKLLNVTKHWIATCAPCHRRITDNPKWAMENNLIERRT